MKLYVSILEKLIELPTKDPLELRHILDDLGLEVKEVLSENGQLAFNIETLANRGDHLYALGVARELSARYLTAIKYPTIAAEFGDRKASVPVRNLAPQCYRYALLEMSLSPGMRLRADIAAVMQGASSDHHPMVDLLNYIQLELGQPMHAFDRDKIDGEIIVDVTKQAEEVLALDGKTYQVPPGSLVIRDRQKIVAVAGVIGCANSMMTAGSTRVLIESACFDPVCVRKTARQMGISTDASYAFERGSDRDSIIPALRRLVHLAEGSAGVVKSGESAHVLGCTYTESTGSEKRKIEVNLQSIRSQLNAPRLNDVEVTSRLKNLGYSIESGPSGVLKIGVPSWRLWDVFNEEDLIEDFVRSHGLSRVKLELPPLDYETPDPGPVERLYSAVEASLLGQGFYEVMTRSQYSSDEVEVLGKFDPGCVERHVVIKNAAERNCSHLKITNIINLCRVAEYNHRRGVQSVKVFELGRLFDIGSGGKGNRDWLYAFERDVVSVAVAGRWFDNEWRKPAPLEDCLFLMKGVLEGMVSSLGCRLNVVESQHPFLHPGHQGALKINRTLCGLFGEVHPALRVAMEVKLPVLYAEFDVAALLKVSGDKAPEPISEFPAIRRDITLKTEVAYFAEKVMRYIQEAKPQNLADVVCVDDFKKADEAFRRVSFRLTFQSPERTLEHSEVDAAMQSVMAVLKEHQLELAS